MSSFELDRLFDTMIDPSPDARPTPFYWWSGADLERETLARHLDLLTAKGIGGTIVGYSHKLDGSVDHGRPTPLSGPWWDLMRWFVDESERRGLTVGVQDYGFMGPALVACGLRTTGLNAGTLVQTSILADPSMVVAPASFERAVAAVAWPADGRPEDAAEVPIDQARRQGWRSGPGHWNLSIVTAEPRDIGTLPSTFDPMHPQAGASLIQHYYERFEQELGPRLGASFRVFFQDELDFGVTMPLWNDRVHERLRASGVSPKSELHLLFHNSDRSRHVREAYRRAVVELLETSYFKPIFEWHEQHGTRIVMDQISRGDLRVGQHHYADFLQTMKWFHGPGNDDPDLTGPRNLAAFRVSASIARQWDRPLVANEAFHSSGWGVTPYGVVAGANVGFAAGANMLILHGLNYTTQDGWWEWASPDFHFRQPWWEFSGDMWRYFTRVCALLRRGVGAGAICVVDPTPDLALVGTSVKSPEQARALLTALTESGYSADLASADDLIYEAHSQSLAVGSARYRAVITVSEAVPAKASGALEELRQAGGVVLDAAALEESAVLAELEAIDSSSVFIRGAKWIVHRRRVGGVELCFIVNPQPVTESARLHFAHDGIVEQWDAWKGTRAILSPVRGFLPVTLDPGESIILVHDRARHEVGFVDAESPSVAASAGRQMEVSARQRLKPLPEQQRRDIGMVSATGVETWRFNYAAGDGPERPASVGFSTGFMVLGPLTTDRADDVEDALVAEHAVAGAGIPAGWRPFDFSHEHGLEGDPYLRDPMAGPHGLKGVPSTFLAPSTLDSDLAPGTSYFFWSTLEGTGDVEPTYLQTRAAARVWLDRELVHSCEEVTAATFPPWGLQDMNAPRQTARARVTAQSRVLLRVDVAKDQPTRVGFAVGGTPTESASKLCWWAGRDAALRFRIPASDESSTVRVRLQVPPGAGAAMVSTSRPLLRADQGENALVVVRDGAAARIDLANAADLILELGPGRGSGGELLEGPVQWAPQWTPKDLRPWSSAGLMDYSGMMEYEFRFSLDADEPSLVCLTLTGLEVSCSVDVNGRFVRQLLRDASIDITEHVRRGENVITLTVANTLANFYRRLPSPYSSKLPTSGGVGDVRVTSWD